MHKLKKKDHEDIKNKFTYIQSANKFFILLLICLLNINCTNTVKNNVEDFYTIDLSVKYNSEINTFQIEKDGSAFVLIRNLNANDKYYKVFFNEKEMTHIQKKLTEMDYSKCDTISKVIFDGTQYIFVINKDDIKREIISGTCEQLKSSDKLVKFIIEAYRKKKKTELFKSLKFMAPPPPPPIVEHN